MEIRLRSAGWLRRIQASIWGRQAERGAVSGYSRETLRWPESRAECESLAGGVVGSSHEDMDVDRSADSRE